jgi:beta-lactamase regulating signal transducer with metallopeptidase domain
MSNLIASLAWCWMQVLLVAGAAIGLSLLTLRRSPTAGATIAWSGVVATLALTVLALVPFPARVMRRTLGELIDSQTPFQQTAASKTTPKLQAEQEAADPLGFRIALDGPLFAKVLKSLRKSESAVVHYRSATRIALGVVAVGAAIGLLRLVSGLVAIASLRRRSTFVCDNRASHFLSELLPYVPLRYLPSVRESRELDSAAVVGWWRPTVMLPAGWQEWSAAELKAVLAHELAHIARRDALWRLVAAVAVALHWGQPLVHWLRRNLLLAQELAADELAAAAMGSKREYLQALAQLALRQDSRPAAIPPAAALLPVFSGFLLRRLVMLRAMDGSMQRNWRLLTQGSAVSLVVAATLLVTAIRGMAEPPGPESDGSIRVANATDAKFKPPIAAGNATAAAGLFQRPPFDITKLALSKQGGFLLRVGEILQQPRFAKTTREKDELLVKYWKDTFPDAEAPPCSLKDIAYIGGDLNLWARYVARLKDAEGPNPHPHELCMGSQCGFIRWQKPVDEIFAWLKRTPGAEEKLHGDVSYVALPIVILGSAKTCICRLDEHTLLWSNGEAVLIKRLDQLAAANEAPAWHNAWKEVQGGLLTAVSAEGEYKDAPEAVDETEKLLQAFFAKTSLKAVGADWQPNAGGNVTLNLQFRFDNEADARSIEKGIRWALEKSIQETREDENNATAQKGDALSHQWIAFLQRARIETRQTDNGWQIEVHLNGPIDIESNL